MNRFFLVLFILSKSSFSQTIGIQLPNTPPGARYDLAIDSGDTIWTGSYMSGLQRYYNGTFTSFTTSNSGIISDNCISVSIDSAGKIWLGSYSGISVFDHSAWTVYTTQNSGLINDTVYTIEHTASGTWIGTGNGLSFFDGQNWMNYTTANSGILSNIIFKIAVNSSTIYTGHPNGISRLDGTWKIWQDSTSVMSPFNINMTYAAGHLWICRQNRNLCYLDQDTLFRFTNLLFQPVPRSYNYIPIFPWYYGMTTDKYGNLIFIYNWNGYYIIKVTPQQEVSMSKFGNYIGLPGLITASELRDNTLYVIGASSSSLRAVHIDTLTYQPPPYLIDSSANYLDINNITAKILNRGDMHWDPVNQIPRYYSDLTSIRTPVYASALWIGGLDQGNQLHTSAMTYRQMDSWDFWTGPLDTISALADTISEKYYDQFWKIDYNMIQSFLVNYSNGNLQNGSYVLPEAIATWPGNGMGNHTKNLAPFVDVNGDGVYNPYDGDYPQLTGHQTLWWVFNDTLHTHTETEGAAFGFEIQGKAYGFNCNLNTTADEVINNTTFYQYKITNRSQNTYHDVYIGLWCDFDLGNSADDYVGCDSILNNAFCYNGDNDDDGGGGYGVNPPMINVTILKGPVVQSPDGLDNNHNGFIDELNETSGLSGFMYYKNVNNIPNGNPYSSAGYYNYLRSLDQNGQPYMDSTGTISKYMFPGTPYSNGPIMSGPTIQPDDMRGLGSSGPFTIAPGESQTIDFAYIFTRDSLNPNGLTTSIAKNTADVQKIINGFNSGNYPCLTSVGMQQLATQQLDFNVYPNPVTHTLFFNKEMLGAQYEIYSVTGQLVKSGIMNGNGISTETLKQQLYIIKALKNNQSYVKRFIKL